jgi:fatty acid desaturase
VNDALATLLLAPGVFADLSAYRRSHVQHHMQLASGTDPDKLPRPHADSWVRHYLRHVFSAPLWWGSVLGHLGSAQVLARRKLYILGWWAGLCAVVWWSAGARALVVFLSLWMLARATAFHAITVFREMCDHYGLTEGGIVSYTRDILKTSMWCQLVHPHNNGHHLTHHLLPAVPYYKLPQAQRLFALTPRYRELCHVCDSYVFGHAPAVARWPLGGNDS